MSISRRRVLAPVVAAGATLAVLAGASAAAAQSVGEVFHEVYRSVVVIRTVERRLPERGDRQLVSIPGQGSGVLISADGKVLTAAHVVDLAEAISVEFPGGLQVSARIVASEPSADVALLQLAHVPEGAVVARLGDSDRVRIGDRVIVVGAPYGISHTLTVGHVSGRHRPGQVWDRFALAEFLQTDAAINQGNSGGPMFSMGREVVGIVSHNISKSGGAEGLGFVVTSNLTRELLLERRARWWGFDGELLAGDLQAVFNLPEPGLLIQRVVAGSPAEALGLRGGRLRATIDGRPLIVGGDVLLRVNGVPCGDPQRVRGILAGLRAGDPLTITVMRDGERRDLTAVVP